MLGKIWDSIRSNHFAMMAVCCMLPVVFILGAQLVGILEWWVYPLAIALCIGSHILMMGTHNEGKAASCHGAPQETPLKGGAQGATEGEKICH